MRSIREKKIVTLNFRVILFIVLGFFLFNGLTYSHVVRFSDTGDGDADEQADTSHKGNPDSLRNARANAADSIRELHQHQADSAKTARTHTMDSVRDAHAHSADSTAQARKKKTDSLATTRKHITDSTASIRKYHDSKHYKDSVTRSRTAKANGLKNSRQAHMDSVTTARKQLTDSMAVLRKTRTDSIKTVQKRRTDSLAKIKKYRASKRYADSVTLVRHERADSIKTSQQHFRDSVASVRKASLDSAKLSRKHIMDSTKVVRTKYMDSLKKVRTARTDSLKRIKDNKEKLAKAKEKKKEDLLKLKLEIKMKQKHEAWSNKSMLKKRWSPVRRVTQNSFTHYNYYFNSNKKMEEALQNMQRSRKENYDSLIGLYPFDPNRDSSMMSADMDSIVHKVSVGIQIHDPRVKWSNDLYLLLGEAYYYKGKYDNASIAFRYIISSDEAAEKKKAQKNGYGYGKKEAPSILQDEKKSKLDFLKHKSVHNESILWLARTYTESRQVENGESVLSLLESDAKMPENLKGRLAIEKAFAFLTEKNNVAASTQLTIAAADNNLPNWLRLRAAFLNGQLLQEMNQYAEAAKSFEQVLTYYPKIEMDFYSRKYIAYNKLLAGEDVASAMVPLKRVLNDGKYVSYYDQVYFVLGMLAVKADKKDEAVKYLTKSINTPKANKKQKALSFAALGDVYYSSSRYPAAKDAYDSASKYSSAAPKDKSILAAIQRSKGLKEVAAPTAVIAEQDSLLALSALSRKEQLQVVRAYLRDLERRQDDSIENAENAGVNSLKAIETENADNTESTWYFANPTLMQQGSADFKKKWGNRPLTDNWRRASGSALAGGSGQDDDAGGSQGKTDNGLPTEESLIAKIPNSPQQKALAIKLQQRAYILLAKAYYKQLEDYKMAVHTLDTLDSRYPDHSQKEEELYARYEVALKQNNLELAQKYSEELLTKYPQSQYAANLRPKQKEPKTKVVSNGIPVATYYDETYNLLMQHKYPEALERIKTANEQYDNPAFKKRFELAEAMGHAGMGDYNGADSLIAKFMRNYSGDTLIGWATTVKEYIGEVRNGGQPSWVKDWPPKEEAPTVAAVKKEVKPVTPPPPPPPPPPPIPEMYSYHADSQHYCILVVPGLDSKTAPLKQRIRSFDSANYPAANLDMVLDMYSGDQVVLLVKKFANADSAKLYMRDLKESNVMHDFIPGEIKTFVISASNYRKMYADKLAMPYASFYTAYYQ